MNIVYLFIMILIIACYISIKFRKEIGDTIFFALSLILILLFVLGCIGLLKYCVIVIAIISSILFVYDFLYLIRNKNDIKMIFYTSSTIYLIIVLVLCICLWNNSYINKYDEFSHWGLYVKNMFNENSLWNINFTSSPNGYPPIVSIFQYFLMKLNGFYSEQDLFRALFILSLLPFISFIKNFNYKKPFSLIINIFIIISLPSMISYDYLNSIYLDSFVGIVFAVAIINLIIEKNDNFKILNNSMLLLILILAKSIGLVLFGIYIIILMIDVIFIRRNEYIKFYKSSKYKCLPIIYLFLPFFARVIWSLFLRTIQVSSKLSIVLEFAPQKSSFTIINNFISSIFENKISGVNNIISLPSIYWILFMITILSLLYYYVKSKNDRFYIIISSISVIVSFLIYSCSLLFSYLYSFGYEEAIELASFDRYMITILMADLLIVIMIEIWLFKKKKISNNKVHILFLFLTFMMIRIPNMFIIIRNSITNNDDYVTFNEKYSKYNQIHSELTDNETICYFYNDSNIFEYLVANYKLVPHKVKKINIESDSESFDIEELATCKYTYVSAVNDMLINSFHYSFEINTLYMTNFSDNVASFNKIKQYK